MYGYVCMHAYACITKCLVSYRISDPTELTFRSRHRFNSAFFRRVGANFSNRQTLLKFSYVEEEMSQGPASQLSMNSTLPK